MKHLLNDRQIAAAEKLALSRGGLCFWKVGEGKTRIALYWQQLILQSYNFELPEVVLVVCRRKAFYDWTEEIKRCIPDASIFENECPVSPLRRAFLLVSDGVFVKLQKSGYLSARPIRIVILDESWIYANHKSAKSRASHSFSVGRKVLGLSGTVMKAKNTLEVYSQAMAVGKHKLVADTPTKFLGEYQRMINVGFPKYYPRPGALQKLVNRLESVTDFHFPKGNRLIHEQYHTIAPTKEQIAMFQELKEWYSVESLGLELDNALALIIKAQQISNGWCYDSEGNLRNITTNKIAKLIEEIESIVTSGASVVIWCAFRQDVTTLSKALPFETVRMLGGIPFDTVRWNRSDVNVCLATVGSGSSVNHFEQTPYAIYFSTSFKWKDMQQSKGRIDRKSSEHTSCYYKYLQVDTSLDSHVYRTVMDSSNQENLLIKMAEISDWTGIKCNLK